MVEDAPEDLDGPAMADVLLVGCLFAGLLPLPLPEAEDESGSRTERSAERGWANTPTRLDEETLDLLEGGGVGVLRSENA